MNASSIIAISAFLYTALRLAVPITLAGIGETISEKSGVLNIGIEGLMLIGAFTSFIITFYTQNVFLGILLGVVSGVVISLIHAVLSIHGRGDQTVIGLSINFLVLGLTSFIFLIFFGKSTELPSIETIGTSSIPVLSQIPILGKVLFQQDIIVYLMFILLIGSWILIFKTEWGVQLTAAGENPRAVDNAGLNVNRIRYVVCAFNGGICGLAGAYMSVVQFGFFIENITAGRGYIALAAVTLGRRNPVGVFLAALLIGATEAVQYNFQSSGIQIPSQFFTILPYIVSIVVLLLSIGKSRDPKALAQPFIRDER
ncbi:ABC transporter permease [Gallicola sp. Sow4_E12]|uniref:ABC transporter permease n=1 Tax=Gallicola sp. Sow4_E12 TaxID=3438785 RepID=UPI003F92BAA9